MAQTLREHVDGRLAGLRQDRYSWWVHWGELATYILPRRYRWLVTPNQWSRGSPINGAIIDSTGTIAARVLAAGMMTGITSPIRPWFTLAIEGVDPDGNTPESLWLAEVKRRMYRVFAESNFYNAAAVMWTDLCVFGTAPMIIYEDFENVINCTNPCAGEYYAGNNDKNYVDVFAREFVMTVAAAAQWFGKDKLSTSSKGLFEQGGASLSQEIKISHIIEPNREPHGKTPKKFPYREVYWEQGSDKTTENLSERGFFEFPCICPRWELVSNDAYGRSPAMDALGDIKQLQQEQKRKAQAIDKMVNPPMLADVQLKNQPASVIPGGVTYISGLMSQSNPGFRPAYEVQPRIQEMMEDIREVQNRIRTVFFNDIFMMISSLQTVRTATEIDARREEKLIMLGPVLERAHFEALDPAVNRTFNIMHRAKLLPPPPPSIEGQFIKVEYVSMLAEAQKAVETGSIERGLSVIGNMAAVNPEVLDNLNGDRTTRKYFSLLNVDPSVMNSEEEVLAIRAARQKQNAEAAAASATPGLAQAAKNLSQANVGGTTALDAILGTEPLQ